MLAHREYHYFLLETLFHLFQTYSRSHLVYFVIHLFSLIQKILIFTTPGLVSGLHQTSKDQLAVSQQHLQATKAQTQQNQTQYETDQHHKCHQTFKTSPYEEQKDINPDRATGTCKWVLDHSQYHHWHEHSGDDLLWISADPGCGKSVLAKSLVDKELQNTNTHTVCYFFFKENEMQDSLTTALCALLHQLFSKQRQLIRHAVPAWEKNAGELVKGVSELWRILMAAATAPESHDVTCVLDALDECKEADRHWLIDRLAGFYANIPLSTNVRRGRLKFLVTSRPYDDIQSKFQEIPQDLPTIRLQGEYENDQISDEIDLVIPMRMNKLAASLNMKPHIKEQLETTMLSMKNRTYLWLHLALNAFEVAYRDSSRHEQVLESLPSSVEDAYEKILDKVTKDQKGMSEKVLMIVIGARRPFNIQEMAIALGIATSSKVDSLTNVTLDYSLLEQKLRRWCGSFVFFNHSRIYLIHQTAKEFLVRRDGTPAPKSAGWKHCLDPVRIEKEMTRVCTELLRLEEARTKAQSLIDRLEDVRKIADILDEHDSVESLVAYSAEYWPSHFRDAHSLTNDLVMTTILRFYDTNAGLHNLWFPIFWRASRPYKWRLPQMNIIRLAALLGHERVLELMLEAPKCREIEESDEEGRTALSWASEFGHEKPVQMLLKAGADVNNIEKFYGGALYSASAEGHEKVVQMLLVAGADIRAQSGECGSALLAASAGGHEKVVQMLLAAGADIKAYTGKEGSALHAASVRGDKKAVQMLLAAGVGVNIQGGGYGTALQAASARGDKKIVQMLLEAGADVNIQGGYYGTALQAASARGDKKIVQMLLEAGADANIQGGHYGTALHAACIRDDVDVVKTLLERRAEVNAQDRRDGTALHAACVRGDVDVVKMLLEHKAEVNAQDRRDGTALYTASERGDLNVVKVLLEHGADVNFWNGERGAALHAAYEGKHQEVVKLLLNRGACVNVADNLCGCSCIGIRYASSDVGLELSIK
jgi:ankyrin repeat protein